MANGSKGFENFLAMISKLTEGFRIILCFKEVVKASCRLSKCNWFYKHCGGMLNPPGYCELSERC
jgi:hypothetical protein